MRIRNGRGAAGSKPTVGPGAAASASAAASALSFLNRRWRGLVLVGLTAATSAAVAVPASASASSDASPVVGHVYVNDNTTGTNTIGAFDRHADGTLTAEPGSPFAAGGAGTGAGLASQGALQISPDGQFLIAGRDADRRTRIPVRRRRRTGIRGGARLAGRAADLAGRPVPDRRRCRQQPDIDAADQA